MIIPFSFPHLPNVDCYFQMRSDIQGTSDNISFECGLDKEETVYARQRLFEELKITQYCELLQVHGTDTIYSPIIYDSCVQETTLQEGDGIATDKKNIALLIKTADCQPILVADSSGTYIMALHVGWRGNSRQYIQKAISEFCTVYSVAPETLYVVRGPSLSPPVSEFIHARDEFSADDMSFYDIETKTMDLWSMTQAQLIASGVLNTHIYGVDLCTFSSPFLFSYRRASHTGRQASIIIIRAS
ncbi:MAG: polyphenol oxidase family protein [Desulfovibrionaceae bacterium]|nr:polyphenol oxidase family protein [Desulfovibrionaceae bacterium]